MIFDPLDIPDELLEAQEQGRLLVFAGAGVSRGTPSDLPDFTGLAFDVAKDTPLEKELSKQEHRLDRYLGELERGEVDIQHLVRKCIGLPTSQPSDLHRWIIDLFLDPKNIRIVTTNFDPHFTNVLTERKLKVDQYFAPALPLGPRISGNCLPTRLNLA
jgi:NAD-dependent SIR2 family protein deacetylase